MGCSGQPTPLAVLGGIFRGGPNLQVLSVYLVLDVRREAPKIWVAHPDNELA
jgi:hypothetical protein